MKLEDRFQFSNEVLVQQIDGEAVVLDPTKDTYFSANEVGAVVLKGIENKLSVAEISEQIVEVFEVEFETAQADAIEFLGALRSASLIEST